jgi:hypothetical protein
VDALTAAAVGELRKAADVGGSAALAARWDWILSEDPDLAGLRGEPAFRRFETEWLPAAQPVAVRPRQIVRLRASRWSVQLCRVSAACVESVWHARAALEGPIGIHEALDWWRDEEASWELARELVHHHRHWQTRLKVIESMQCFADRNGARFRARHPRYMERPIEGDAITVDRLAGNEIHFGDLRLNTLADVLDSGPPPCLGDWRDYLHALDKAGRSLEQPERAMLAANRALAWGSLRRVFSEEMAGGQRLEKEFRRTIEAQFREVHLGLTICPPPVVSTRFNGSGTVAVADNRR